MSDATPTCPACGAKFAHSRASEKCNKCGLPDEVLAEGARAIARWKKSRQRVAFSKNTAKKIRSSFKRGTRTKNKNKHGRARKAGGDRVDQEGLTPAGYRRAKREKEKP